MNASTRHNRAATSGAGTPGDAGTLGQGTRTGSEELRRRLERAEGTATQLNLPGTHVVRWDPGQQVHLRRLEMTTFAAFRAACWSAVPSGILALLITPFLVPWLGILFQLVVRVLPVDPRRLQSLVADLFGMGPNLLFWVLAIYVGFVLATWLRLTAAEGPFVLQIDWVEKRLSVRARGNSQECRFDQLVRLELCPFPKEHGRPLEASDFRLVAISKPGPPISLAESDRAERKWVDQYAIDRLAPLAKQLAASLDLPLILGEELRDDYNLLGFRRDSRWRDWGRVWRRAAPTARAATVVAGLSIGIGFVLWAVLSYQSHAA